MIIYAKCIKESQIGKNHEEFIARQNEDYSVYCVGETTVAKHEGKLYCVPLNYIFRHLHHGEYVAIIEYPNSSTEYTKDLDNKQYEVSMNEQKVLKIFKANSRDLIDYVANEVKDHTSVGRGSMDVKLSAENVEYFKERFGVK